MSVDDAGVVTHTQQELQTLIDHFSLACKDLGFTISLKKTNVLGEDNEVLLINLMSLTTSPTLDPP